ncbi:hypothetical protein M1328_05365 [Patescibacteria group bacterium]|nr:hypothetical protein [Patescibacteria group bacterium]
MVKTLSKEKDFFYRSVYNHVWDTVATNFLMEQAGGAVTDLYGEPWTLESTTVVAARDQDLHKKLIEYLAW